jgi:hypothetical protein
MLKRAHEVRKIEVVKDPVPIVIKYSEVVGLFNVFHDHIKMLSVSFLCQIDSDLIGDELIEPFSFQLLDKSGIRK